MLLLLLFPQQADAQTDCEVLTNSIDTGIDDDCCAQDGITCDENARIIEL
jgi:hypothetical protein